MRVALVYVMPNLQLDKYVPAAQKFVGSYQAFSPGSTSHELYVTVNGAPASDALRTVFRPLTITWMEHNNWSKDLGAFVMAAQMIDCDLLICCGSHVNFCRSGWLDRIVEAQGQTGPCLGGPWGSQYPNPHLRTTMFWCPPEFLQHYPFLSESDRYGFEHGRDSITLWSQRAGFEPYQVTWQGCWPIKEFHPVTLEETLALDQHTKRDLGK